jgi:hypothetical protein
MGNASLSEGASSSIRTQTQPYKTMKNIRYLTITMAIFSMALTAPSIVRADEEKTTSTTTTVTSDGTVSESSPDAIVVRTSPSAAPIHYITSRTTTYVDENGNPVSVETVKSGLPVTVYYDRSGDQLMASRVVVRNVAAPVIQKSTTTTTTKKEED